MDITLLTRKQLIAFVIHMERKVFFFGFLMLTLLLAQTTVICTSLATPEDTFVRLDAKGGIPGKPTPPEDPPIDPEDPQAYELFIEIDYMEGHEPTQAVLDYIKGYYQGNNPSGAQISVTFYKDDVVPLDTSVSTTDFWAIESEYNDLGDDKIIDQTPKFTSKWKWVLFGTVVEGESNVMGYTYVATQRKDLVAGNYIFIADKSGDDWASNYDGIEGSDAEAVVLMHELGHSIGIAKLHPVLGEQYDPDPASVMSYLSTANAGLTDAWYYSDNYWATSNLEYYVATP
ncbi:MAG: hypothetical protein CW716_07220 [Candidatus Bathyarchaeum sp.]|nr:MAG: hypothetical protein CW716_07220 [Candidatus Bathyarchaeum sp.]